MDSKLSKHSDESPAGVPACQSGWQGAEAGVGQVTGLDLGVLPPRPRPVSLLQAGGDASLGAPRWPRGQCCLRNSSRAGAGGPWTSTESCGGQKILGGAWRMSAPRGNTKAPDVWGVGWIMVLLVLTNVSWKACCLAV